LASDDFLLAVDLLEFLGFDFDLVADIVVFLPFDSCGSDDEILVEESFHSFHGDEHPVIVAELDVSFIFLS